MANSEWKQAGRDWRAARRAEERERAERREQAARERNAQNVLLRANGYQWRKVQDIGGPSDDGDNAGMVWQLYDVNGHAVTVREALAAIAAAKGADNA